MEAVAWVLGIGIGLFLLFKFTKPMLIVLGVVAALVGAFVGYMWISAELSRVERSRIAIVVRYGDATRCAETHPLHIIFTNQSNKTLERVGFSVEGRLPQHSDTEYWDLLSSDRIIEPKQSYYGCWSVKTYGLPTYPLSLLEWTASVSSAAFR